MIKGEQSLKVIFFAVKNRSEFRITTFLLVNVAIQIWVYLYALTQQKMMTFKQDFYSYIFFFEVIM